MQPTGQHKRYHSSVPSLHSNVVLTWPRFFIGNATQRHHSPFCSRGYITTACTTSIENWNANVITGNGHSIAPVSPLSLSDSVCTSGFGAPKYLDLCSFACKYGYCPAVCTCTSLVGFTPSPFLWPIRNKTANSSRVLPSRNLLPRM